MKKLLPKNKKTPSIHANCLKNKRYKSCLKVIISLLNNMLQMIYKSYGTNNNLNHYGYSAQLKQGLNFNTYITVTTTLQVKTLGMLTYGIKILPYNKNIDFCIFGRDFFLFLLYLVPHKCPYVGRRGLV